MKKILITGGAGFIGCHLCDELVKHGHHVTVLDNLAPQVHGLDAERPPQLNKDVELVIGDVRDVFTVEKLVEEAEVVFHLASIGNRHTTRIQEQNDVNNIGTAVLLQAIIKHPVKKLLIASCWSIYGEGCYRDATGQLHRMSRSGIPLATEGNGESDRAFRIPVALREDFIPSIESAFALTKYDQETLGMLVGSQYNIDVCALRFFTVYGPGQSFMGKNANVVAEFASKVLLEKAPLIMEDGNQIRDFVYVSDAVRACRLAMESPFTAGETINVGSGIPTSISSLARIFEDFQHMGDQVPIITGEYRGRDVRCCFADISKAKELLNYQPEVSLKEGVQRLMSSFENPALLKSLKNLLL